MDEFLNNKKLKIAITGASGFVGQRLVSKLINRGEKLSKKNIKIVRPNLGLHPKFFNKILGKISKQRLTQGAPLKIKYLKNFK